MHCEFAFVGPSPLVAVHRRFWKARVARHEQLGRHGQLGKWVQFDPVMLLAHAIIDGRTPEAATGNFSTLHMPTLVVNNHYQRGARRLGLVASHVSDVAACKAMDQLAPETIAADDLQPHYCLVKQHSQVLCRRTSRKCRACSLRNICRTGREAGHEY